MSIEVTAPRSRRALLAAAAGAAAATVASAIERPSPVRAGTDGDVVLGAENTADAVTKIRNNFGTWGDERDQALWGDCVGEGTGVHGTSEDGYGVLGESPYVGVSGVGNSWAVVGAGRGQGTGVYGSGAGTGVEGESYHGRALSGYTNDGIAAFGQASREPGFPLQGTGVYGWASDHLPEPFTHPSNTGVCGNSPTGTGVRAESATGTALDVRGKAKFSRSKKISIASGKSSLKVTLTGVTSSSYVLATLQSNRPGVYVRAVVCASGSFTIYLNKAVTAATNVAYFVVN